MRVQQRADDALAGLVAWEETSLADLRAELDRAGDKALKQVDAFRSGALADVKELLNGLRSGEPVQPPPVPKAAAKPAEAPVPAPAKPVQTAQAAPPKPAAKANT